MTLKKKKQIVSNLRLAEGQRTEDGMTNGAGNEGTVVSERQTIWNNVGTV